MTVKQAVDGRFSARDLILDKKISESDLLDILNAGIHAPSGFGIESWNFYVLDNKQDQLVDATGQEHFKTAPITIVVTSPTEVYCDQNPEYMKSKFLKSGFPEDKIEMYIGYLKAANMNKYMREQSIYAVSQMVLQAKGLGMDTCIVGGFDKQKVLDLISSTSDHEDITALITLGYSASSHKKRQTRNFEDVVTFVK